MWKFWCDPVDEKGTCRDQSKAGHLRIPLFHFDETTPLKEFKNKKRNVYFAHLFIKVSQHADASQSRNGCDSTRQCIALHHFPSQYLRRDGPTGLTCEVVSQAEAIALGLTKTDLFVAQVEDGRQGSKKHLHEYNGMYILPPCRKWNDIVAEFLERGGTSPTLKERIKRTLPPERATTRLANDMTKNPEMFAIEYEKLQDEMIMLRQNLKDAKKDKDEREMQHMRSTAELEQAKAMVRDLLLMADNGITRRNLSSDAWHKDNNTASHHLFGGHFFSWDNFKVFWTEGAFPEMKVEGGSGPITEFEKLMMTNMRAYRAYEYETIAYMFGVDRRRVGEFIREYTSRLGEIGLHLSLLDLTLTHDYLSLEDATELGVAHSQSLP
jgi:hypothetical protein